MFIPSDGLMLIVQHHRDICHYLCLVPMLIPSWLSLVLATIHPHLVGVVPSLLAGSMLASFVLISNCNFGCVGCLFVRVYIICAYMCMFVILWYCLYIYKYVYAYILDYTCMYINVDRPTLAFSNNNPPVRTSASRPTVSGIVAENNIVRRLSFDFTLLSPAGHW